MDVPGKVSGRFVTGHVFSMLDVKVTVLRALIVDPELCCTLQYIYRQTVVGKTLITEKNTLSTFGIEPNSNEALCTAADRVPDWVEAGRVIINGPLAALLSALRA